LRRLLEFGWLLAALWLLAGCGQVITRITPIPTATPTVGLSPVATPRPTATPAPYTPAPTPTPTVTPTPIIYIIQPGDNLLKIARQFGVSVEALREANGITDPRLLQINQELVIPREEMEGEGTPTPTPTPLPFAVENITFSYTPLGGLWCFGEVHNTTDVDLEQAGVMVTLLDAKGQTLAQEQEYVQVSLIGPGERAPFAVHFAQPPAGFDSYLAVPWVGVRGYVGSYYRDLEVRELRGEGERYATYYVTGKVANIGPEDAVEVIVTVTIYDALGRVIGSRQAAPEHNVIPRGGETTFAVQLTPAGGPVSSFRVTALGRRVPTPTPASQ